MTVRRPNTSPTRDRGPRFGRCARATAIKARAISARKQPHDRVLPARREAAGTIVSSPQAQRQRHNGRRRVPFVLPARARTVSRPNTWPTRLLAFTGGTLAARRDHWNHRSQVATAIAAAAAGTPRSQKGRQSRRARGQAGVAPVPPRARVRRAGIRTTACGPPGGSGRPRRSPGHKRNDSATTPVLRGPWRAQRP